MNDFHNLFIVGYNIIKIRSLTNQESFHYYDFNILFVSEKITLIYLRGN